jgi:arylsulfatase A-like enzyme
LTRRRETFLLLALLSCLAACHPTAERPNVVLVSIDTLRADALSASGGPVPTPVLDALARGGVLFTRAIAPSPETAASHATLFTGLDVLNHGVLRNGDSLGGAIPTLAESFRSADYATAAFVSSFVLDPRFGWNRGFERYDATFTEGGSTMSTENAYEDAFWNDHEFSGFDRRAAATTRAALAWLESVREPFFLFVHFFDPHAPYRAPPRFERRAAEASYEIENRSAPGLAPGALAQLVRSYHGEVLYTDFWLGKLLLGLGRRGVQERTLVVVTGDHGEGLGQHGWVEHGRHLYEEQIAVPLLFHWPERIAPREPVGAAVGLVAAAETIASLAGVEPPQRAASTRLAATLLEGAAPPDATLFGYRRRLPPQVRRNREMFSVREGRWKYIAGADDQEELYDLETDPGELRDLAVRRPDVVKQLRARLEEKRATAAPRRPEAPLSEEARRGLEALGYLTE